MYHIKREPNPIHQSAFITRPCLLRGYYSRHILSTGLKKETFQGQHSIRLALARNDTGN